MPVARQIALPGEPDAWARARLRARRAGRRGADGAGRRARSSSRVEGLAAERPDGLAIVAADAGPAEPGDHPNGAAVVDHVVALTDDLARTLAALERPGSRCAASACRPRRTSGRPSSTSGR